MGCLPESGGCEHRRIQPFIDHINETEATLYRRTMCLDVEIRDTPQPEVLYTEESSGEQMVVERKCFVWPPDYAARHRNDHHLVDLLLAKLPDWVGAGSYTITLPSLLRGTRRELEAFAERIVAAVVQNGPPAGRHCVTGSDRQPWSLRRRAPMDLDAPPDQVLFTWNLIPDHGLPPWPDQSLVVHELRRLLASAQKKFAAYTAHRCITLLEPQGALSHTPVDWWSELLSAVDVPLTGEVWLVESDWDDAVGDIFWFFDRLVPTETAVEGRAFYEDRSVK